MAAGPDSQATRKSSTASIYSKDQYTNTDDKATALVPSTATKSGTQQLSGSLPTPLCFSSPLQSNITQAVRIQDGISSTSSHGFVGSSKKTSLLRTSPSGKPQEPATLARSPPSSAKKRKKRKRVGISSGIKSHDPAKIRGKAPVGGQQSSITTHSGHQLVNRQDADGQGANNSFGSSQSILQQVHQSSIHDADSWKHPILGNGDGEFSSNQLARSILDHKPVIPRETPQDQVQNGQQTSNDRVTSKRSSGSKASGYTSIMDNPRRLRLTVSPKDSPNFTPRTKNPNALGASKPRNNYPSKPFTPRIYHPKATAHEAAAPKPYDSSIYRRHDTEPVRSPQLISPAKAVKRATVNLSRLPLFGSNLATLNAQQKPTSRASVGECKSKKPSVEEQQLRRPKLDRYVPHDRRTSDQELIRIGRYKKRYDRHISAPYAFRWDGKLFSEYRYLVDRIDTNGDGWDDVVRKRLI